jgi:hypothetical protein
MLVYPKNFAIGRRTIEANTCFVLIPFKPEFDLTYGLIKDSVEKLGLKCNRVDDLFESQPVLSLLLDRILRSEFIRADLTSKNANVFYEVGLAHSFRDTENVILISQSMNDIPFDIQHLPIIIYSAENKYLLAENLKRRINTSRGSIRQKRFLLDYFSDSRFSFSIVENFIDKIQARDSMFVEKLHMLLSDNDEFVKKEITSYDVKNIISEIDSFAITGDKEVRKLLYKVKLSILVNISDIEIFRDYCISYLEEARREVFETAPDDKLLFSADYACMLIKEGLHKSAAINWLLNYLQNSRVGCVDVIRNKIDEFLIQTTDEDVEVSLLRLLNSDTDVLRESSVDILTQKKSITAYSIIINKLMNEKNVYVVRSMINGLGRYDNGDAHKDIVNWINQNKQLIATTNAFFLIDTCIDYLKRFKFFNYSEEMLRLKINLSQNRAN